VTIYNETILTTVLYEQDDDTHKAYNFNPLYFHILNLFSCPNSAYYSAYVLVPNCQIRSSITSIYCASFQLLLVRKMNYTGVMSVNLFSTEWHQYLWNGITDLLTYSSLVYRFKLHSVTINIHDFWYINHTETKTKISLLDVTYYAVEFHALGIDKCYAIIMIQFSKTRLR
jgi:hypothetical protein